MTALLVNLAVGLVGLVAGIIFQSARDALDRRRRKRALAAALVAEATSHGVALWRLLQKYPRSDSMAPTTDEFLKIVAGSTGAGDVFLRNLASADVIEPEAVRVLTDAYVALRTAADEGARLAKVGSFSFPQGITWALKDRLADIMGQLHRAVQLLDGERA